VCLSGRFPPFGLQLLSIFVICVIGNLELHTHKLGVCRKGVMNEWMLVFVRVCAYEMCVFQYALYKLVNGDAFEV
jgi:hypothetical protein